MRQTASNLIRITALFTSLLSLCFAAYADNLPSPPDPKLFQAGDLIWPKKPHALVPYNSRPGEAADADKAEWDVEKEAYLKILRSNPSPTPEEKLRYSALESMDYNGFLSLYIEDEPSGKMSTFGAGEISVGHVGIIDIENGSPVVVEAVLKPNGVRKIEYSKWLAERVGEIFWVARLKGVSREKRAGVAKKAETQIGKPYNFWNFNLEDTSGFYCSKLAWLAITQTTGEAPDDNPNPKRIFWYSPKQLMRSRHLELIANPGDYGTK